jgi:hypothetical protein
MMENNPYMIGRLRRTTLKSTSQPSSSALKEMKSSEKQHKLYLFLYFALEPITCFVAGGFFKGSEMILQPHNFWKSSII